MKTQIMKHLMILALVAMSLLARAQDGSKAKVIKDYFSGWEKKDWSIVAANLAGGFTFTSPAPDDHIDVVRFKEKCWVQADHIRKFDFPKITETGNQAFALVHVVTMDGRVIRNVELFTFDGDKIKSIEVFFGGGGEGFPTNVK